MGIFFLFIFIIVIFVFIVRRGKKKRMVWSEGENNFMTLDDKYNESKVETQRELDRLLDKVGKKGYKSLSKREKELLNEYSKKV